MMIVDELEKNKRWRVLAPAKINLFFEILGKRLDGFHEIQTVVAPIDLYDRLEFERAERPGLSLECYEENGAQCLDVPNDDSNLVTKAYRAFCNDFNLSGDDLRLKCRLYKKIPTKSGLGGGSSDAAAALTVFNMVADVPFNKERLQLIAGTIGSDVALFLEKGASIGRGRGELVEPLDMPSLSLVLLKPREGLSTPAVYRCYDEAPNGEKYSLDGFCEAVKKNADLFRSTENADSEPRRKKCVAKVAALMVNRLEEPASRLWSGWSARRDALMATGALAARMTGSGSAFFAVYPCKEAARQAAERLQAEVVNVNGPLGGDRVFVVQTLSDFPIE